MLHSVAHGHDPLFVYLFATMMNRARELEADSHRSNICIQILSSVSQSIQSAPIFHHRRQPGVYRRLDVYPPLLRRRPPSSTAQARIHMPPLPARVVVSMSPQNFHDRYFHQTNTRQAAFNALRRPRQADTLHALRRVCALSPRLQDVCTPLP